MPIGCDHKFIDSQVCLKCGRSPDVGVAPGTPAAPPAWRVLCSTCGSSAAPTVTKERWDSNDRVIVGCAICRTCGARSLFSRLPTPAEAAPHDAAADSRPAPPMTK